VFATPVVDSVPFPFVFAMPVVESVPSLSQQEWKVICRAGRAEEWENLIERLETLEDTQIARKAFAQLRAAKGSRSRAGWIPWKSAEKQVLDIPDLAVEVRRLSDGCTAKRRNGGPSAGRAEH
jgi:hypothetical protein